MKQKKNIYQKKPETFIQTPQTAPETKTSFKQHSTAELVSARRHLHRLEVHCCRENVLTQIVECKLRQITHECKQTIQLKQQQQQIRIAREEKNNFHTIFIHYSSTDALDSDRPAGTTQVAARCPSA